MFLGLDRKKKKGLQADWILQKGVELRIFTWELCLIFFLSEFQGKVGRSNYHILITSTHLQKPLSAKSSLPLAEGKIALPQFLESWRERMIQRLKLLGQCRDSLLLIMIELCFSIIM